MIHRLKQSVTDPSVWMLSTRPSNLFALKGRLHLPRTARYLIYQFLGDSRTGILITYVDDLLVMADTSISGYLMDLITKRWKCTQPTSLRKAGSLSFGSLNIQLINDGQDLFIDQASYCKELLDRHPPLNPNVVPLQPDLCQKVQSTDVSTKTPKEIAKLKIVNEAQQFVGELNWLATKTRHDIAFAAHIAASLTVKEPERSIAISKGVLRYLTGT